MQQREGVAPKGDETRKAIVSQLFYTVGALTSEHAANGQIGRVETGSVTETIEGDLKRIKYTAKLPVAWPKGRSVPRTYKIVLPKDTTKLEAFNAKYDGKCGRNEYGADVFWHDFNPIASGCTVDDADVSRSTARVTKNKSVTTGKYPEYAKVWEDGALNVVALFGDARYNPLSEKADLVVYNGHSELSKNTNALARKGKVAPKQYQVFFFDSCDTYAYLDTKLVDRRREVNGADDPKGTKYLDVATNVLPSYFSNYAASSLSFVKALAQRDTPKTYNQIMTELPSDQVVVVTGEDDNTFKP